jgi:alpha-ketoglutarate-dependent taurine dioxygenase
LQGGLAAAPGLMTLVSRPVLAQQCTTPSGSVSLNASTAGRGVACTGHQPGYWLANTSAWNSTPYNTKTHFDKVFAPHYPGKTLLYVLNLPATPPYDDVAGYSVAALLNLQANLTPVLTFTVVKDM